MTISITTLNLNGIRASQRKGFESWLTAHTPDVLALQETRAPQDVIDELFDKYAQDYAAEGKIATPADLARMDQICDIKGRAGVGLLSDMPITARRYGLATLSSSDEVDTGRWIEADIITREGHDITVCCIYDHAGDVKDPIKMAQKYRFLDAVMVRMDQLSQQAAKGGPQALVLGDFNIAHTALDLKDAKRNADHNGFLPQERAYIDRIINDYHYVDITRRLAGDVQGPYTWWTQRGRAYENNAGWRIDYQFATPQLAATAQTFEIDRKVDWEHRWSDHAPLTITYNY